MDIPVTNTQGAGPAENTGYSLLLAECRFLLRHEGAGSPEARALFAEFYREQYARVEHVAAAKIGRFYAQDLAVETFWRAWQWLNGPSDLLPPGPLLAACLDRVYPDMMRRLYGRHAPASAEAYTSNEDPRFPLSAGSADANTRSLLEAVASEGDVELEVLSRERTRLVRRALSGLGEKYRECVRCRYLLGMSVHESALELGLTVDQVKKYTAHALVQLAQAVLQDKEY